METDLKAWWFKMSEHRLVNHLTNKMGYPPAIVARIVADIKKAREARRKARIKDAVVHKLWAQILGPARAEITSVRNIKSQLKKSEAMNADKWDALCQYETAIAVTIERIKKIQKLGEHTPKQFAEHLKKEGLRAIPNEGEHWTDWVAMSKRQEIVRVFNGLPPPIRGRNLTPFKRKVHKKQYQAQRIALIDRLNSERENAEQEYDLTADEAEKARLGDLIQSMHKAMYLLDSTPKGTPLPSTWQGLLK